MPKVKRIRKFKRYQCIICGLQVPFDYITFYSSSEPIGVCKAFKTKCFEEYVKQNKELVSNPKTN